MILRAAVVGGMGVGVGEGMQWYITKIVTYKLQWNLKNIQIIFK